MACTCCGNTDKKLPTCGLRNHPCQRREKERNLTVVQKFEIICDVDIELCVNLRNAYEIEIRDFLVKKQEPGGERTRTLTIDEIINKLRI